MRTESEQELIKLRKLVEDQAAAIAEKDMRIANCLNIIKNQRSDIYTLKRNLEDVQDALQIERINNSRPMISY